MPDSTKPQFKPPTTDGLKILGHTPVYITPDGHLFVDMNAIQHDPSSPIPAEHVSLGAPPGTVGSGMIGPLDRLQYFDSIHVGIGQARVTPGEAHVFHYHFVGPDPSPNIPRTIFGLVFHETQPDVEVLSFMIDAVELLPEGRRWFVHDFPAGDTGVGINADVWQGSMVELKVRGGTGTGLVTPTLLLTVIYADDPDEVEYGYSGPRELAREAGALIDAQFEIQSGVDVVVERSCWIQKVLPLDPHDPAPVFLTVAGLTYELAPDPNEPGAYVALRPHWIPSNVPFDGTMTLLDGQWVTARAADGPVGVRLVGTTLTPEYQQILSERLFRSVQESVEEPAESLQDALRASRPPRPLPPIEIKRREEAITRAQAAAIRVATFLADGGELGRVIRTRGGFELVSSSRGMLDVNAIGRTFRFGGADEDPCRMAIAGELLVVAEALESLLPS